MLEFLRIRNLALIQDMELEFSPGFNALTGESGAGKSFIVRALEFLTGDRLDPSMVRPGQDLAQVEALFVLPDQEYVLRRELSARTGRSRIYVNDRLGSQDTVRGLRPKLLVHAGQHGQQRLLQPSFQARILDRFVDGPDLFARRAELLTGLAEVGKQIAKINEKRRELAEKRDLLEYRRAEIEKVNPKPGEEQELEVRRAEIKQCSAARETIARCLDILHSPESGFMNSLSDLARSVRDLAKTWPEFDDQAQNLDAFMDQVRDLDARLRNKPAGFDAEADIEAVEARLFAISQLKRKLKRPLEDILKLNQEIAENLSFLDASALDLKRLEKQQADLAKDLDRAVLSLNQARQAAAKTLCSRLETDLKGLGFPDEVKVAFEFAPAEIYPGIYENKPRLMWMPNPGQPPQPLDKIASGGELSRFFLAVVGLTADTQGPALIFDEVDAGVGGLILNRVGERLKHLAQTRQILVITHWPQLACLADRHFAVRKEIHDGETYTLCQPLQGKAVKQELARMAGGGDQGLALAEKILKK